MEALIIAVDYDNTLDFAGFPKVGVPNIALFEMLKKWRIAGNKVILWTCREGKSLQNAIDFCKEQGLEFDAVNDNTEEAKSWLSGISRKIFAHYYLDDRAIGHKEIEDQFARDVNKVMRLLDGNR